MHDLTSLSPRCTGASKILALNQRTLEYRERRRFQPQPQPQPQAHRHYAARQADVLAPRPTLGQPPKKTFRHLRKRLSAGLRACRVPTPANIRQPRSKPHLRQCRQDNRMDLGEPVHMLADGCKRNYSKEMRVTRVTEHALSTGASSASSLWGCQTTIKQHTERPTAMRWPRQPMRHRANSAESWRALTFRRRHQQFGNQRACHAHTELVRPHRSPAA